MADEEKAIHRLAGRHFNLNAPRELGETKARIEKRLAA